jgi:hypothetical protein
MGDEVDGSKDDMETKMGKKKKKVDRKKYIPFKVCWCLPIIPRLKRLFANTGTTKLMSWHTKERTKDAMLKHPTDSP